MKALSSPDMADRVRHRRRGRVWAGRLMAFGAVGSMVMGLMAPEAAVAVLGISWLTGVGAYLLGSLPRRARLGALTEDAPPPGDSIAKSRLRAHIHRYFTLHEQALGSIGWPMAAICLLAPISLHFLVFALAVGLPYILFDEGMAVFGYYMGLTGLLLIPAYATLVNQCRRFAERLAELTVAPARELSGGLALVYTVLAACLPGILLFGVPPMLVALTGVFVVPAVFEMARSTAFREKLDLMPTEQRLLDAFADDTFAVCSAILARPEPMAVRIKALRFLADNYPLPKLGPVLDQLLGRPGDDLTLLTLDVCRTVRHRPGIGVLAALARRGRTDVASAAVKLLVVGHGPLAERALLSLLTVRLDGVCLDILDGLGRVGTRESIAVIRANVDHRVPFDAANRAIRRIQRRLPSAERGSLSFATGSTGELSVAAPVGGGLLSLGAASRGGPPADAIPDDGTPDDAIPNGPTPDDAPAADAVPPKAATPDAKRARSGATAFRSGFTER